MSPSPSFNSYSNSNLAEIAARVVQEFRAVEDGRHVYFGDFYCQKKSDEAGADISGSANKIDADHGDFEFALVNSEGISTVSADEIFHNGKILPVYPTELNSNMKTPILMNSCSNIIGSTPLRKLLAEERQVFMTATSSSSSSDVPAETYCVRLPKATPDEKRSRFPASLSKKWKLKDFLSRSFSVGSKDSIVFSSPNNRDIRSKQEDDEEEEEEEETIKKSPVDRRNGLKEGLVFLSPSNINGGRKNVSNNGKWPPAAAVKPTPPLYNRDGGEKRRSYLPYRQQQVGFLAFMNGLGKNLQPF